VIQDHTDEADKTKERGSNESTLKE
jgi:hypothetical protein